MKMWYYLLSENGEKVEVQIGILKTDYVDYLQRTNVTSMIGRKMLESQLRRLGVFDAEHTSHGNNTIFSFVLSVDDKSFAHPVRIKRFVMVDEDPAEANKDGIDGNVEVRGFETLKKLQTHDYNEFYSVCKDLLADVFDSILNKVRFESLLSVWSMRDGEKVSLKIKHIQILLQLWLRLFYVELNRHLIQH
ncbi:phosphoinositide phosphatase SAC6-like protein [Tanacetum coccineum]